MERGGVICNITYHTRKNVHIDESLQTTNGASPSKPHLREEIESDMNPRTPVLPLSAHPDKANCYFDFYHHYVDRSVFCFFFKNML